MRISTIKNKVIKKVMIGFVWLMIWQILCTIVNKEMLIPSPFRVAQRLSQLLMEMSFWLTTLNTVVRILMGFLLAVVAGVVLAILTVNIPLAYDFFYPVIGIIKATPIASFIILALVWIQSSHIPTFIAFLIVLPVVWSNIATGIQKTDPELIEMGKRYEFGVGKMLRYIYIPSVMPYFMSASTVGIGMAWKSGVAAEVISMPKQSIGTELYYSKIYIETVDLFAWTLVVIILSMVIELFFVKLIKRLKI